MLDRTVKFIVPISVVLVALMSQLASARVIYENHFNEASDIAGLTSEMTGFFSSHNVALDDGQFRSSPQSLMLVGSGYTGDPGGTSEVIGYLPLGAEYDMWAGGGLDSNVSVWVLRYAKANNIAIELRHDSTVRASGVHVFTDYGTWHEVTIPLDDTCTDINTIVFRATTYQYNSSSSYVFVDDFLSGIKPEFCGDLGTFYLPGDANKDCQVNILDLAILGSSWLECNDPQNAVECTD